MTGGRRRGALIIISVISMLLGAAAPPCSVEPRCHQGWKAMGRARQRQRLLVSNPRQQLCGAGHLSCSVPGLPHNNLLVVSRHCHQPSCYRGHAMRRHTEPPPLHHPPRGAATAASATAVVLRRNAQGCWGSREKSLLPCFSLTWSHQGGACSTGARHGCQLPARAERSGEGGRSVLCDNRGRARRACTPLVPTAQSPMAGVLFRDASGMHNPRTAPPMNSAGTEAWHCLHSLSLDRRWHARTRVPTVHAPPGRAGATVPPPRPTQTPPPSPPPRTRQRCGHGVVQLPVLGVGVAPREAAPKGGVAPVQHRLAEGRVKRLIGGGVVEACQKAGHAAPAAHVEQGRV